MNYERCPFCQVKADRRRIVRENKLTKMARLESGSGINFHGEDNDSDEVELTQFVPCGHEFDPEYVEKIDNVCGEIAERREEIVEMDAEGETMSLLLSELSDYQEKFSRLTREAQSKEMSSGPLSDEIVAVKEPGESHTTPAERFAQALVSSATTMAQTAHSEPERFQQRLTDIEHFVSDRTFELSTDAMDRQVEAYMEQRAENVHFKNGNTLRYMPEPPMKGD